MGMHGVYEKVNIKCIQRNWKFTEKHDLHKKKKKDLHFILVYCFKR